LNATWYQKLKRVREEMNHEEEVSLAKLKTMLFK
jgi:hypothetical protein